MNDAERIAALEKRISQLEQTVVRMKAQARGPKGDQGEPGRPGKDGKVVYAPAEDSPPRIPAFWRIEQRPDGTTYCTPEY